MDGDCCSPYPHHSWLAHWLAVHPPRVFDAHDCRHVAHHLLLTTVGEADIRWGSCGTEIGYHSAVGGLGFFPCDHHVHSMSITSADGFVAYDVIVPDQHIRAVCAAEGVPSLHELRAVPDFRDTLMAASLLRLSARLEGHPVSEDIGDDIAARQIVLRLCAISGGAVPEWQKDGSVFRPCVMRQLVAGIDAHLGVPMSLAWMANSVQLSPGHFARKFQHSAGVSLNRFINTRRIAASFTLLQAGANPLAGIALDLGFSSQSHFTRLFSGLTGMSPQQFRRLHRPMVG
ncbi:MAG: AraC family transcriptional regulator [Planctomycetia bacterium]|nr:AraC family transcriptional regulator [Planctomycetia bacterium]